VEICEIHGIPFDKDAWICPVCGKDRCRECDYVNCVVDSRKKDYECSFKCEFCNGIAGLDHKQQCAVCGAIGCSNCIGVCNIDGVYICPDCGSICSQCGKRYTNKYLEKCELCPALMCSICSLKECHICGKRVCQQHSFKCVQCGKYTCNDCMGGLDEIGGGKVCRECTYICPTCASVLSIDSALECKACGAKICRKCARVCEICGKSFCREHIDKCTICDRYICGAYSDVCPACGGYSCNKHFFKCELCGVGYCEKCRAHEGENLCNLCDHLNPLIEGNERDFLDKLKEKEPLLQKLSGWEFAKGREVYVFYGKSIINNYIIVADRKSESALTINKVGIMDKIKRIFS